MGVALPVTAATDNPVLGYNVALLLSFVLSGVGMYLLALRLTRSSGAGLAAGTIFCFSAYRMTNLAQAQLLTTQWMPFALLALLPFWGLWAFGGAVLACGAVLLIVLKFKKYGDL